MLELPFWLSLLFWSLLPSIKTPWLEIESIPFSSKDIVIFVVSAFYLMPGIRYRSLTTFHKPWDYHLLIITTILYCYAAISVNWSGIETRDTAAMIYTLVLTFSGFLLAYNLIAKMSSKSVRPFLWRFTVYLAVLGLIYSAESFLSLGLRSEITKEWTDFGIQRVAGPLFGSSTGYFILIPALAFSVQETIQERDRRFFKLTVVFSLMITLISLGSRAGLLLLCIFFVFLLFSTKDNKQRFFAIILMIIIGIIAIVMVFSHANTERLGSLEDKARSDTYSTALEILKNRSDNLNIFGSGYGSYWSWYLRDVDADRANSESTETRFGPFYLREATDEKSIFDLVQTSFGPMLYHPHSTLLLLVVELGVPGLLYLFILFTILVRLLYRNFKGGPAPIFTCGVAASGFSMFFDLFIFKNTQVSILWWILFLGDLALPVMQVYKSCQIPVESINKVETEVTLYRN